MKPQSQINQKKKTKERVQVINYRNKRGDITADFTDIKRVLREYYGQL